GRAHATNIGNHKIVRAGIGGLNVRKGQCLRGLPGEICSILPPLKMERSNANTIADRNSGAVPNSYSLAGRSGTARHERRVDIRDAIKAEVINSEIPTPGANLRESKTDGGLVICLGKANHFNAL